MKQSEWTQWTTDDGDTEYVWGKTDSMPTFAAASFEGDLTRPNGLITIWLGRIIATTNGSM